MKYRRILVPTDFSNGSAHALRYACRFALCTGSELVLLHVMDLPLYFYRTLETQLDSNEELKRHAMEQARAKIQASMARIPEAADLSTSIRVRTGNPAREIIAEVEQEKNIDLIVIATHGRGGIARTLLGSVAEKVIRRSPCAVITMREGSTGLSTPDWKTRGILFPTDFSKLAEQGLPVAADLCQRFHAPLHALHVLEDLANYPMMEWAPYPIEEISAVYAQAEADATANLQKLVEHHCKPAAVTFDVSTRRGNAADAIVQAAEQTNSDLIVMMTHGRSGFEHAILGSVAERVARTAPCAVLTLRAAASKKDNKKKSDKKSDDAKAKSREAKSQKVSQKAATKRAKQADKAAKKDQKKTKRAAVTKDKSAKKK